MGAHIWAQRLQGTIHSLIQQTFIESLQDARHLPSFSWEWSGGQDTVPVLSEGRERLNRNHVRLWEELQRELKECDVIEMPDQLLQVGWSGKALWGGESKMRPEWHGEGSCARTWEKKVFQTDGTAQQWQAKSSFIRHSISATDNSRSFFRSAARSI